VLFIMFFIFIRSEVFFLNHLSIVSLEISYLINGILLF